MQTMTSLPPNGNTRGQGGGKQSEKTCHLVGRGKFYRTTRYFCFCQNESWQFCFLRLYTWTWSTRRPHSPTLDWLLQKKLSLPRQPSDKSLTLEAPLYRFVKSYNALLVSQVKFISPGGPWQGPNRPDGFGDWCQQWRWLANSTDSCFTRLSGLNHTPLRMQIVQVVFPNEHCGPGYSSM